MIQNKAKFYSQRPKSSAKARESEVQYLDTSEKKSKIPIMPKRTYSLDWKGSYCTNKKSIPQSSTTSMIPRLDKKKYTRKPSTPGIKCYKPTNGQGESAPLTPPENNDKEEIYVEEENPIKVEDDKTTSTELSISEVNNILEAKISEDFIEFKKNIMRIPEYWSETGNTVTNILKNAENVIAKQYPTADMKTFEAELKNVQIATKAAKEDIIKKTERIINRANRIYCNQDDGLDEEEMQVVSRKMKEIENEVDISNKVIEELLKNEGELEAVEPETPKSKKTKSPREKSKIKLEKGKKGEEDGSQKRTGSAKSKFRKENITETKKKGNEKIIIQSCGDGQTRVTTPVDGISSVELRKQEDKASQTINLLTVQLYSREQAFHLLNSQVMELQQLCKDHISKFKNFNLQIKLRGLCNKSQSQSTSKELQYLYEEKQQLAESNQKLMFYNRDLQSAVKQKEMDLYQKDKIIGQQKKLLLVRDELIEMLKNKINLGDSEDL